MDTLSQTIHTSNTSQSVPLSYRFLELIKSLLRNKQNAWERHMRHEANKTQCTDIYAELIGKYTDLLTKLRNISKALNTDKNEDKNQFINNICEGILCDTVVNRGCVCNDGKILLATEFSYINNKITLEGESLDLTYLQNLHCLDSMSSENQNIIDRCLNAFAEDYVLPDEIYDQIEKTIGKTNDDESNYVKLLYDIHFHTMTYRLDAVYKIDPSKKEESIENLYTLLTQYGFVLTPDTIDDFKLNEPKDMTTINEYKALTQHLEVCMKKYADIDLLKTDVNINLK